ncbi:cob(I)alamin adenosyltransferase [Cutibacterium acnes JCM 18920]|nr:cob(I)alamin adenosyltransferase [Cutibacterium acnes JCM 18920]
MPHARTSAEPDDGLSTRQRRLRPVLVVNTGEGKGKTTAAMGTRCVPGIGDGELGSFSS